MSSKGLYTVVYDDTEDNTVLGYFTPTGRACCYYRSGRFNMLSDPEGGSLFDEVSEGRHSQSVTHKSAVHV